MRERKRSGGCCGWCLLLMVLAGIAFGIFVVVKYKMGSSNAEPSPVPGAITQKYADALKIAILFFDVQKCTFPPSLPLLKLWLPNN